MAKRVIRNPDGTYTFEGNWSAGSEAKSTKKRFNFIPGGEQGDTYVFSGNYTKKEAIQRIKDVEAKSAKTGNTAKLLAIGGATIAAKRLLQNDVLTKVTPDGAITPDGIDVDEQSLVEPGKQPEVEAGFRDGADLDNPQQPVREPTSPAPEPNRGYVTQEGLISRNGSISFEPPRKPAAIPEIDNRQRFGAVGREGPQQGPLQQIQRGPGFDDMGREDARIMRELNNPNTRYIDKPLADPKGVQEFLNQMPAARSNAPGVQPQQQNSSGYVVPKREPNPADYVETPVVNPDGGDPVDRAYDFQRNTQTRARQPMATDTTWRPHTAHNRAAKYFGPDAVVQDGVLINTDNNPMNSLIPGDNFVEPNQAKPATSTKPAPQVPKPARPDVPVVSGGGVKLGKLGRGVGYNAAALGVDVALDAAINQIPNPAVRETTRFAKDAVGLFAAPIVGLLGLSGDTPKEEVQLSATDTLVNLPDGNILVRSKDPAFDSDYPLDIRKWKAQMGNGNTVETVMSVEEANELIKGKKPKNGIREGSIVPSNFRSTVELDAKNRREVDAMDAERVRQRQRDNAPVSASEAPPAPELPPAPSAARSVRSNERTSNAPEQPRQTRRASELPTILRQSNPEVSIKEQQEIDRVRANPSPSDEEPTPAPKLDKNATYKRMLKQLGKNPTKEERDAVRDYGLEQHSKHFPQLQRI